MKFIRTLVIVASLFAGICPAALGAAFTITPSAVSNTYSGTITLQITGLTPGSSVVVQKFLDANTNGVIDAADLPVQQFNMTDGQAGQVIGGVTNFNVAGDTDGSANGTITAKLNFQNGDFVQNIIGKFLFKVSGNFTPPVTNVFTVTNFPFAQKFTGNVVSNSSSTLLSNGVVLLFPPPRSGHNGPGKPLAGAVANNGAYSIMVPAGTYTLVAFYTNYVGTIKNAPVVTLGSGLTVNTNLTLTNATGSITGQSVDANTPTIVLPGDFTPVESTNGLLVSAFTASNGTFTAQVTAGGWELGSDDGGLIVHGYVGYGNQGGTNASSGGNVTLAFPKANAMFYGSFKDTLGNPFVDVDFNDYDSNSNLYSMDGYTDTNGNFFVGAVGGLGLNDTWQLSVSSESSAGSLTNYIISQPQLDQYGATNLSIGQALLVNFTAIFATNTISGTVKDTGNNAISNVQVYAYANIGGVSYQSQAYTDVGGNYSVNVATNASWSLNVYCGGSQNSLPTNYMCPNSIMVNIANNNVVTNFVIQSCGGISISPVSPLPVGEVGVFYNQSIQASDCSGNYNWSQPSGTLPNNLSFNSGGQFYTLSGNPNAGGSSVFTVSVNDGGSNTTNRQYSVAISNALQITTTTLPNGTNGLNYSQQLHGTAGVPFGTVPYSWSAGSLPANLNLATNGLLSGAAAVNGTFNFNVQATDALGGVATQALSLTLITTNAPPLAITTAGGQFFVLWPASAGTNFTLQTATNVAGPWATATNGVPQNAFSFSNTAPAVFFRLH
jgi:hypothetical protein